MGWFNNWFGTLYYKLLYQHRDDSEAHKFLDRMMSYLPVKPGMKVIDVGCGQGRHSLYLSEKGFNVVGLDLSKESIAEATRSANSHLKFIQHDMRQPFPVKDADLALNLFTSFGYFQSREENLLVLRNVHNALNIHGILVLDFFNSSLVKSSLVPEETVRHGQITFLIKRYIADNKVVKEIAVEEQGHIQRYFEKVELLRLPDFVSLFRDAGFEISKCFGNYKLEPFNPVTSDRLILVASKTNAVH
jgi:cyclopropane fatty-acyl-phospholipid synthase-like methyltransferase